MVGDNGLRPRLLYLGNKTAAAPGDKVVTSGDGEAFPPGLPIGQVAQVEEGLVEVEPFVVRDRVQNVRVVDFGLAGILAEQTAKK
jgi:rod shape-determining protein MreC